MAQVRCFRPEDLDDLYRVCLETADAGKDATALHDDAQLLGHVYVGAYARFQPDLAFVLEDDRGIGGYVLGALDTTSFDARLEEEWWPPLRRRYPLPPDGTEHDAFLVHLIHSPHHRTGRLLETHPSHLHIDLVERCQGAGHGRRLMTTLLYALRAAGSPGVHLGVSTRNERAIGFYRHLGFEELAADELALTFGRSL